MKHIRRLELQPTQPKALVIEPWAEEFQLLPHVRYLLELQSNIPGEVEIQESKPSTIVAYAWSGAVFKLSDGEGNVIGVTGIPVPRTPNGFGVSEFLDMSGLNQVRRSNKPLRSKNYA